MEKKGQDDGPNEMEEISELKPIRLVESLPAPSGTLALPPPPNRRVFRMIPLPVYSSVTIPAEMVRRSMDWMNAVARATEWNGRNTFYLLNEAANMATYLNQLAGFINSASDGLGRLDGKIEITRANTEFLGFIQAESCQEIVNLRVREDTLELYLGERFKVIETSLSQLNIDIKQLDQNCMNREASSSDSFTLISNSLDELKSKQDKLVTELNSLKALIAASQNHLNLLNNHIGALNRDVDTLTLENKKKQEIIKKLLAKPAEDLSQREWVKKAVADEIKAFCARQAEELKSLPIFKKEVENQIIDLSNSLNLKLVETRGRMDNAIIASQRETESAFQAELDSRFANLESIYDISSKNQKSGEEIIIKEEEKNSYSSFPTRITPTPFPIGNSNKREKIQYVEKYRKSPTKLPTDKGNLYDPLFLDSSYASIVTGTARKWNLPLKIHFEGEKKYVRNSIYP